MDARILFTALQEQTTNEDFAAQIAVRANQSITRAQRELQILIDEATKLQRDLDSPDIKRIWTALGRYGNFGSSGSLIAQASTIQSNLAKANTIIETALIPEILIATK